MFVLFYIKITKFNYMKTLRKHSLLVLATLVVSSVCCAQTAEEIVAKNIAAVGGKDLIAATKSIVITASIEVMGNEAPSTMTILNGKGYKSETDFMGSKVIRCVTDKGGWGVNPFAGQPTPTAMPDADAKQFKDQVNVVPLIDYTDANGKLQLLGQDTADYKIKLTNDNGVNTTFFINMKTYLIDRMEFPISQGGQTIDVTLLLSDYQKIDNGLMMPFKMEQDTPQLTLNITNKKVEVNKEIDPMIFEMPK